MTLDPAVLAALVAAVAFVAGKYLFKFDTRVEERRRAAGKIAGVLRSKGLDLIPNILENYAVGDYSGMAEDLRKAATVLTHDPANIDKEFDKVFGNLLTAKLADPAQKALLLSQVGATVSDPVAAVLNSPELRADLVTKVVADPALRAAFLALLPKV